MADMIEVGLIMGSDSDWATMKEAANIMEKMGVMPLPAANAT